MMMEISHAIEEPDGNAVVKRLSVPVGLEELMTSLTKEVLKKKPIDIYNFASDHFGQLLTLRESGGYPEPTSKIITYVNKVSFKADNKSQKQIKDKQLARQVNLNVQPFIQDFKIVGKKSVVQKSEKRNRKEEVTKQKNEKLKASRQKSISKQDQEKNENGNKSKTRENNSEEIKKNKKVSDKTSTSKGKHSKIKKRFKSVDNFTSFSNFSMNHNIIDPEDIQINTVDKDNLSLSSENINKKNYTASALRRELIKVHDESKLTSFASTYNPYKLRQEIRSISKDEAEPTDELDGKVLRDHVTDVTNNENANTDSIEVLTTNDDLKTESEIEKNILNNINEDNKVENVEEKVCSINESDIGEDKNNDEAVITNNNSNFCEVSVIQKEEIEANGTHSVDEHNRNEESVKEVSTEEKQLKEPFTPSNEESGYNTSKIFASAGMAALKIQSMWRGFRTRKNFPATSNNVSNLENTEETSSKFSEPTHEIISKAASKIQAGVRGYLTRKQSKTVLNEINGKSKEIQKVPSENVASNNNNNNVFSNVEQNDNSIKSNENTEEVSIVTANSNNANDGDNQTLKEDETNILKLENYELNNLEGTPIQENLHIDPLDLNNEEPIKNDSSQDEIDTVKQENEAIDVETIEQKNEPLNVEASGQEVEFIKENLVNESENNKQGTREKRSINFQEIIEEENNKLIDSINNSKNIAINSEPKISEVDEEINTSRYEFRNESTTEQESSKTDSSLGSILQHSGELHDAPTNLSEESKLSSDSEQASAKEDVQILKQSDSFENNQDFQKDSTIEQETNTTDSSIGSILQHSGELHDSLTHLNEENKLSSDSEPKSANEDIDNLTELEFIGSIENNQKEESNEKNSSVGSILQHSGELHDTTCNLNEENKLSNDSEQNLTNEDVKVLMQSEVTDSIVDNQELQKDLATEEEPSKTDQSIGSILQHSGELHDTTTYLISDSEQNLTNEDVKVLMQSKVADSIGDNQEIQKDSATEEEPSKTDQPIGSILQHSGELHDTTTNLNEENKLSSDSEQNLTNEDVKVLMQSEVADSIGGNQELQKVSATEEERNKTDQPIGSILQHSGELHDTTTNLNEENKLSSDSEQNLTNEDVKVLMQSDVTDNTGDNEKVQKDSATEEERNKIDQPVGVILQHSGEIHDAPSYFKEENKLSSDSTGEIVEKEEIKSLSNLEHSGELHDVILVENSNNQENEDRKRKENTLNNIESLIESDDEIKGKIENKEEDKIDKVHYVNIIEDSSIKLEDTKVEEIEEDYRQTIPQDTSKLRTDLYEIEETTEDDDSIDNNLMEDINVVSQFNDINIDKEAKSEDAEKRGLDEKDANVILEGESEGILKPLEETTKFDEIINAENIYKSDDLKMPTELNEIEKSKVPEDDLVQSETVILQLADSPSASKQGIESQVIEECIEETIKSDNIVNVDSNNFDVSQLREELDEVKNTEIKENVVIVSEANNFNNENNNENPNLAISSEGKDGLEKNSNEEPEIVKLDENVEIVDEVKKFDITKLRAELENSHVEDKADSGTHTNGNDSVEKNNNGKEENVDIESVKVESNGKKFDLSKLRAELSGTENLNAEDVHSGSPINGKDSVEKNKNEENAEIGEIGSVKVESDGKKFDMTKLRAELSGTENSNAEDVDKDSPTNGNNRVEKNNTDKEESADIEIVKIESDGKKFDITKLRAELSGTENSNAEDKDSDSPTNGNDSVEKNNNDKEEKAEIGSVKVENDGKKFDMTKLRAELSGTENSNAKDVDSRSPTNENDRVEKNNNDKEENAEIESVKVESDGKKFDMTKLRAELSGTENFNAEDKDSDSPTNGNDSVQKNNNDKVENDEIGSVKVENDEKKFDMTKLRAELSGTENSNAEDVDSGSPINGNNSVEKNNNDIEENAEIGSVKVESDGIKFDITKLRTELSGTENSNDEDVDSGSPINGNNSVEKNNNDKEENAEIGSVKVESDGIKFDITKLRTELSGTENSNDEDVDSGSPINGNNSVEKNNNDKEENAEIGSVKVESDGIKFDITKLRTELSGTENSNDEDVDSGSPINGNNSVEKNNNDKEENAEIGSVKVESDGIKFDITKLRTELSGTENSNDEDVDSGSPINGNHSVEKNNNDKEENADIESIKVESDGKKFDMTKLRAELSGTENSNAEDVDSGSPINGNNSVEKNNNDIEENAEIGSVKVESDGKKFDMTKLRAELSGTENSNAEDVDSGSPINGNNSVEKNNNDIEENAEIGSVKVESDGKKFDMTKLRAELSGTENSSAEDIAAGTSTNGNDSVEKNNNYKEENAEIGSVKFESDGKKFDMTKLPAELSGTENSNAEDSGTPTNGNNIVENNNNGKEENADIESVKVESDGVKFDITKLRAELSGTENSNAEDVDSGSPINGNDSVEKNINDKEENAEIGSVKVESDGKKFDMTKLRAELSGTENSSAEDIAAGTPTNGNDSVEKNNNYKEENAEIRSVKFESDGKKFDMTKLRAELSGTENSNAEDSGTPTNGNNIVENNNNGKEENADIESVKVESDGVKFDMTKLRAELSGTENSSAEDIAAGTPTNGKDSVEEKDNDKEEISAAESVEVDSDIKKFDITKLRTELENSNSKGADSDTPTNGKESADENKNYKEESVDIESVEVGGVGKNFDITKLRAELNEAENASTQVTDSVTVVHEEENKDVKQENAKIEENVEIESTKKKFDITKLRAELNETENLNAAESETNTTTNGKESAEKNKNDQEKNVEIGSVEVESDGKNFDITKLRAELDEAENASARITDSSTPVNEEDRVAKLEETAKIKNADHENIGTTFDMTKLRAELSGTDSSISKDIDLGTPTIAKDSTDEDRNDKEEKSGIAILQVERDGKKFDITKLRAELNETENSSSKDIDSDIPTIGKDSIDNSRNDKEENVEIENNLQVESDIKKIDIAKSQAELSGAENSKIVKANENENDKEDNAKTKDIEVETDVKKFDIIKLRDELDEEENSNSKNADSDTPTIVGKVNVEENKNESTAANVKSNESDFSKLPLNDTETSKVSEENLNNSDNLQLMNENESHSILQLESTPQLHLIDKHNNNDAIKPNTTDDVDQQLTVINNDFEDENKRLKDVNSLQVEPLPTTHSIIAKEFEFIPTESSDNLLISPNDSNQSFSNKEIEPKIDKEVMTNTNQESNFNQTSLNNNETNSVNQQDDMTDERAPSGISASPDSDVTVIFNSNTLNKLDDNLVNISGNSSPTVSDKTEASESVTKDTSENTEKNAFDISKSRMEIEDPSKVSSKEEVIQEQKEDLISGSSSEHKLKEAKTKDTLNNAATVIQSIYRGYQVRTKLKDSIKKEHVLKTAESKKEATYPIDEYNLNQTKKEHGLENEDFAVSDVLGKVLNQQLAIAAPHAVEVDKSGNQPEYIRIPLKGSLDESGVDENSSLLQLQHSGEFHDIFPIPNLPRVISKNNKLDEIVTQEDNTVEKKLISSNLTENKPNLNDVAAKQAVAVASDSLTDDNIVNEETVLKLNKAGDGSVPQALEVVLNQQLAIATPCAKFEEKEKETEKVDYIHIPLKDPNGSSDNDNIDLEVPKKVDVMTVEDTTNSLSKQESNESANKNDEAVIDSKQFNQPASDVGSGFSPSSVNSENNKVLMNYSLKKDGSIQDESMPMVVQNTQLSENTMPVEGQPNQAPGAEILTSSTSVDETEASLIIENAEEIAQTSEKDASSKDEPTKNGAHLQTSMETSNRENTTSTEQNMENVAATKIQASFRGYQVRKQLKPKNGGVDSITLRRSLRRKSSGKLRGSENTLKKQTDNSSDLEEKSATKIQAGIRGFLVRRRQTKAKTNSQKSS